MLALAGCPSRHLVRLPGDAYGVSAGDVTDDEAAAAREALERAPEGPDAGRNAFLVAGHARARGDTREAERAQALLASLQPGNPWLAPIEYLVLLVARKTEGSLRLLKRVDEALRRHPADTAFRDACEPVASAAFPACTQSDLENFLSSSPDGLLAPEAMLSLGKVLRAKGAGDEAVRELRTMVSRFPSCPAAPEAFALLKEMTKDEPTDSRVVGALLPVSGRYAKFGASVLQGVRLAAADMEAAGTRYEFVFADTAEDPEQALQAMGTLLKERKAVAIFGPLFSATALACAAEANLLGVVMVTPSALTSRLSQTGPYVFRVSLTPERQAQAMARHAIQKRSFRRFGVLAPDNAYGRSLAAAFAAEAAALGGTVLVESAYPPQSADFGEAIIAVGGADVGGFKEREEESRRDAQTELEAFLRRFYETTGRASKALGSAPVSSTVSAQPPEVPVLRVACLLMTTDPFTTELGLRLRAAGMATKAATVLAPQSGTAFTDLRALGTGGEHASATAIGPADTPASATSLESGENRASSTILDGGPNPPSPAGPRQADYAIMVSAAVSSSDYDDETLRCELVMRDLATGAVVAQHAFHARRPLPPSGNRFRLDAVYAPVPGAQLVQIIPQMSYHGLHLPMLGSDSWDDETLRKRPEAVSVDASFTTSFWPDMEAPVTRKFVQRYKEAYAAPPDALAANAYDAAMLLMNAIGRSDRTREGLREAMSTAGSFDGVCGPVRITPQREIEKEPIILRVANGTISPAP